MRKKFIVSMIAVIAIVVVGMLGWNVAEKSTENVKEEVEMHNVNLKIMAGLIDELGLHYNSWVITKDEESYKLVLETAQALDKSIRQLNYSGKTKDLHNILVSLSTQHVELVKVSYKGATETSTKTLQKTKKVTDDMQILLSKYQIELKDIKQKYNLEFDVEV